MSKQILGHIDCPSCGTAKGMRITHDKNGEPFGFCEANCNQQMRIGGDKRRVKDFVARYPWAGAVGDPVPVTEAKTAPSGIVRLPKEYTITKRTENGVEIPLEPPAPAKRKPVANPFDFLLQAGKVTA